jgi:hypothetical protein
LVIRYWLAVKLKVRILEGDECARGAERICCRRLPFKLGLYPCINCFFGFKFVGH